MQFENYPEANWTGFHDYHSTPSNFTESIYTNNGCIGIEIEMDFPENDSGRQLFTNSLSSNMLWASRDSSLSGRSPMEICTVPLMEHDAVSPAFWRQITRRLVKLGARSHKNPSTGLHVHVSRKLFYKERADPGNDQYEILCARTLYGLYVQDAPWKKKLFQRSSNRYAQENVSGEIIKLVQTTLPEILHSKPAVQKMIQEARSGASDRYSEFNVTNVTTIEFRCGKGTLSPERIAATAEFALLFAKYCRSYGKKIYLTSQKHFDAFIARHARTNSILKTIFSAEEEE